MRKIKLYSFIARAAFWLMILTGCLISAAELFGYKPSVFEAGIPLVFFFILCMVFVGLGKRACREALTEIDGQLNEAFDEAEKIVEPSLN